MKKLKEFIVSVGFICLLTGLYPKTTFVEFIDKANDVVFCSDMNGDMWAFDGCEGWQHDDICSMIMDDNGTEDYIYDDEIIVVKYDGHL